MRFDIVLFFNSILLGIGLAMDAFSVSLANGLNEPFMKPQRMSVIAGVYAFFQALMPMTGWICVHTILQYFRIFEKFIPWIALLLLSYIGGKMILESKKGEDAPEAGCHLGKGTLLLQGIATSIDALSVGFTIADYHIADAVLSALIIAVVTFIICLAGLNLGKRFGTRFAGKASLLGGLILVGVGIEIFIKGTGLLASPFLLTL